MLINGSNYLIIGGAIPAELGEQDGKNAAAAAVGLVNGKVFYILIRW